MSVELRHRPPVGAIARTELATGLRIQRNGLLVVLGLGATLALLMLVAVAQVPVAEVAEEGIRHRFGLQPPIGILLLLGVLWPLILWKPDPVHGRGYMWAQAADRRVTTAFRVLSGWIGLLLLIGAIALGMWVMGAVMQPMVEARANAEMSVTLIPHAAAIVGPTILYLLATCFAVLFRRPGLVLFGVVVGGYIGVGIAAGLLMTGVTLFRPVLVFLTSMMQSLALAVGGGGFRVPQSFLGVALAPENWAIFATGWLLVAALAAAICVWIHRETAR